MVRAARKLSSSDIGSVDFDDVGVVEAGTGEDTLEVPGNCAAAEAARLSDVCAVG